MEFDWYVLGWHHEVQVGTYPEHLIRDTIQKAGTDWDFELFCTRLYTLMEGFNYLPTSRTYDLGADGRRVTKRALGESFIVSTLQETKLVEKAIRDVKKLIAKPFPVAKVRICYAFIKTNSTRTQVREAVRLLLPSSCELEVTGITDLVEEAGRYGAAFEETYHHQLDVARRQLEPVDQAPQSAKRLGLRVLLAAQLNGDAAQLRKEILRGLVLQNASRSQWMSSTDLAREVSGAIGFNHVVQQFYLQDVLQSLQAEGLLEADAKGLIRRRGTASDELSQTGESAAIRDVEGFGSIKRSMAVRLDDRKLALPEAAYPALWQKIQGGLVDVFRKYGAEFVEFVQHMATSETVKLEMPDTIYDGMLRIAQSLEEVESLPSQICDAVIQDLPLILLDVESGARDWLTHLCLGYVSACSLGLHPDALKRLEVRIKTWEVMPDTHVLLSALGEGEEDHDAIQKLLGWWRDVGGTMLAAPAVMEEIVRHAEIGSKITERWARGWQQHRSDDRPEVPDTNVFLRAARAKHSPNAGPGIVTTILNRFLVSGSRSTARVAAILQIDYGLKAVDGVAIDSALRRRILREVQSVKLRDWYSNDTERDNAEARCECDATLLAFLAAYRKSLVGTERQAVILSQAAFFHDLHQKFGDDFGLHSIVIDPTRLLFAVAMMPGAAFTIRSVEAALFGEAFRREVRRNEQLARRVAARFSADDQEPYVATLQEQVDHKIARSDHFSRGGLQG